MGKQFGVVHLSGQYGNVRMVIDGGKGRAHLSDVVTKDRIMTEEAFAPTRENMSEFTGAALAASALRKCLGNQSTGFGERYLTSRMQGLMRRIVSQSSGIGGERSVEIAANAAMAYDFDLNREEPFAGRFKADYDLLPNVDRNMVQLDVPVFDTRLDLAKPQGATHFRVYLVAGLLADYQFVGGTIPYQPVNAALNGLKASDQTAVLPLRGPLVPTSIQLTATIANAPVVPVDVSLVVGLGIEFYRQIGGTNTLMGSGNAMRIERLF